MTKTPKNDINICMIATTHNPFDGRIYHKEAKSLAKLFRVKIIAPSTIELNKTTHNIDIITIKKQRIKFLHFITLWKIFNKALRQNCHIYHCHEPDSALVGILLKYLKGAKVIYDIHEHWPSEVAYGWFKLPPKGLLYRIIELLVMKIEKIITRRVDYLIVASKSIESYIKTLNRNSRIVIIPNAPLLQQVCVTNNVEKDSDIVLVGGGLQEYHGVIELLEAVAKIKKYYPNIRIKIIGKIKINLTQIIEKYNLSHNIIITGYLPYEKMYQEIRKGKIGVVIFKPIYFNAYIGLPNKLFDYMLCGLTVVASNLPEIRRILHYANCGMLVNPYDVEEIAKALYFYLSNDELVKIEGERCRKFIENELNWEFLKHRLVSIYMSILYE